MVSKQQHFPKASPTERVPPYHYTRTAHFQYDRLTMAQQTRCSNQQGIDQRLGNTRKVSDDEQVVAALLDLQCSTSQSRASATNKHNTQLPHPWQFMPTSSPRAKGLKGSSVLGNNQHQMEASLLSSACDPVTMQSFGALDLHPFHQPTSGHHEVKARPPMGTIPAHDYPIFCPSPPSTTQPTYFWVPQHFIDNTTPPCQQQLGPQPFMRCQQYAQTSCQLMDCPPHAVACREIPQFYECSQTQKRSFDQYVAGTAPQQSPPESSDPKRIFRLQHTVAAPALPLQGVERQPPTPPIDDGPSGATLSITQSARRNRKPLSPQLHRRVQREARGFLDEIGFGTWTEILNPDDQADRVLILELLDRLYNRQPEGFYVKEVYGERQTQRLRDHQMHPNYFDTLMLLARHKVLTFAEPKTGLVGQYDVCYDLPAVYNSVRGYFDTHRGGLKGTGGGRKRASPDLVEGRDFFKSKNSVKSFLTELERNGQQIRTQAKSPRTVAGI